MVQLSLTKDELGFLYGAAETMRDAVLTVAHEEGDNTELAMYRKLMKKLNKKIRESR